MPQVFTAQGSAYEVNRKGSNPYRQDGWNTYGPGLPLTGAVSVGAPELNIAYRLGRGEARPRLKYSTKAKRIEKPWGFETILIQTPAYAVKYIHILAGHRLSLQYHEVKTESVIVQESGIAKGNLTLTLGKKTMTLEPGQRITIPPKTLHRFAAGKADVLLLEISSPELDDVVRISDDYGRTK